MKLFLLTVIFIINIHNFFSRDFCKEYCQSCCDCCKKGNEENEGSEESKEDIIQEEIIPKKKIFEYVPKYVMARPDSKYRKDFANFLTYRTWETEPLTSNTLHNGSNNQYSTPSNWAKREIAMQNTKQLVSQLLASSSEPAVSFCESEG